MNYARVKRSGALLALINLLQGSTVRGQAPASPPNPRADEAAAVESAPVVAVRIVAEDGRVLSAAATGLPVIPGKPLDRDAVRESLHVLFRTGDYADVQAVRVAVAGGVRLDFVVRMNLFFNVVKIEGLTAPPTDSTAAAAMQITLG